jgi:hypothetical protein
LVFVKKFPRRLPSMTHITVLPYQLRLSFYSSVAAASLYAVCGILHGREMRGGWGRAVTLLFVFPFLSICKTQLKIDGNGSKSSCARLGNCRCCCCCPETMLRCAFPTSVLDSSVRRGYLKRVGREIIIHLRFLSVFRQSINMSVRWGSSLFSSCIQLY